MTSLIFTGMSHHYHSTATNALFQPMITNPPLDPSNGAEELLSKEAQKGSLPDNPSDSADRQSQEARLDAIIAAGLNEQRRNQSIIAGHEFNLSNRIDQAARLVLWAKDWIGEAAKQGPEASIVWAGVGVILPLLTNPKVADEANRDGFTYVTTPLIAEANNQDIQLYQLILELQLKSVRDFTRAISDVTLVMPPKRKIGHMVRNIKEFEGAVDGSLIKIIQFAATQELESFNMGNAESLQSMPQLLYVSEEQLFRLTDSSRDATYEWYKDCVKTRVDATCEWFLKYENFQRWLKQDSGVLLVSVDPGCGKSVLAKYLIEFALPRSSIICYYFSKNQDQNTCRQALCAFLHQLLLLKPCLIEHAMKKFDIDGHGLVNSTSSLWAVLRDSIQDPRAGHTMIVLDALDE
ncbi:hypothetical protein F4678DRAFT_478893 [Xylaria arbuscula]|nr:hypothetical protein F4678DRAFT_478893 [Xylaria arbuscula]